MPEGDYAGDVSCKDAWGILENNPAALLVDVRTQVEWQLIGQADLSSISKEPLCLQWVTMQGMNKNFIDELQAALDERGVAKDTPLYFMCQSGGRSKMSAMQCAEMGYSQCFNIAEGFEGELNEQKHRNSISGWKVAGLPWTQA
ncbi:MAG: rhodanese-like domain-containing protein [Gammaproteobacteria bacterium]|nr:rhodanese-like domain-containing protein [Gammaproteobacteria bacterium]MCP4090741.1 rhodanese-like domain-containing protein [Gammaproteobacteria bacterium]MCP4277168.1 rhodanese-like domain-containing protein [Gammaproteobacteria bacterium]MCP4831698.1 rhodanese-like domain-containing protein [Gammaproteobacteria bacterium]MCP4928022.1 rhodanese-like domain-containing protein [Gammaproteobacteria bacterium]